jgi:hypothetical protein
MKKKLNDHALARLFEIEHIARARGSENADDPEQHEDEREPDQDADQDSDFGLPPHLLLVRREPRDVPSNSRC